MFLAYLEAILAYFGRFLWFLWVKLILPPMPDFRLRIRLDGRRGPLEIFPVLSNHAAVPQPAVQISL
jgi:hypothetical protein